MNCLGNMLFHCLTGKGAVDLRLHLEFGGFYCEC